MMIFHKNLRKIAEIFRNVLEHFLKIWFEIFFGGSCGNVFKDLVECLDGLKIKYYNSENLACLAYCAHG